MERAPDGVRASLRAVGRRARRGRPGGVLVAARAHRRGQSVPGAARERARRPGAVGDAGGRGQARPRGRRRLRRRRRARPDRTLCRSRGDPARAQPARPHPPPPSPPAAGSGSRFASPSSTCVRQRSACCPRPSRDRSGRPAGRTTTAGAERRARARDGDGGRRAVAVSRAHVGLFQIAGRGGRRAAVFGGRSIWRRPSRRGGRLASRRRPDRDERRRLGNAVPTCATSLREAAPRRARGRGAASSARSAIRRATMRVRTTARRWAPTTSPASPGCTRSRRATAGGGWYRVYPGYVCPGAGPANANGRPGATYNRLGPAVALAAPGEPTRWSEHIAADDSSQSSAWRRPPRRASSRRTGTSPPPSCAR